MNWHGLAENKEPVPPADPAVPSCVWCGQQLPVACPSGDFGSDVCEARWMAWHNRVVPIEPVPELPPVPAGGYPVRGPATQRQWFVPDWFNWGRAA